MFKINSADQNTVVMDVESSTMSMLADLRSATDNAYINIHSGSSYTNFNNGYALGTSNLADGSVVFAIGSYSSNVDTTRPSVVIHNSNIGFFNNNPQYALDVTGDINATSTIKIKGVTVLDSTNNLGNINNLSVLGPATFNSNVSISGPEFKIPVGTTAQRPAASNVGMIRYNTDLTTYEGYGPGNAWGSLGGVINTARTTFVKATETDTILFENASSQSMIIDASGQVGIGTTAPGYKLDVYGDINASTSYKMGTTTILDSGCNLSNIATANTTTLSNSGTVTTQNLYTSDSVGINKSSAAYTLDVSGDIAASSSYLMGTTTIVDSSRNLSNIETANITTTSNSGTVFTKNIFTSDKVGINQQSASYTLDVNGDINASTTYKMGGTTIVDSSRNLSNINTVNSTTISNSGTTTTQHLYTTSNVGINQQSAAYTLDVFGDVNASTTYKMGGTTIVDSSRNLSNINTVNSTTISNTGTTTTHNLNTTGSVGINTASPGFTLDVNGEINASSNVRIGGVTVINQNRDIENINTINSTTLSNSGTVTTQNLYTSDSVGINKSSAAYTLDVSGDIAASSSYLMGTTTIIDSNRNLSNIETANVNTLNSTTLSNVNRITTSNLTVTGEILGSIYSSQVSDLASKVYTLTALSADTVNSNVSLLAQSSITTLNNVNHIGSTAASGILSLDSTNTIITGTATVLGTLTSSNLTVLGTTTIINSTTTNNSNVTINNQSVAGAGLVVNQLSGTGAGIIADFNDTDYSSTVPVLRINESGSIGINTTDKTYTLNVNGTGHFSSNLIIDGPGLKIPVGTNSDRPQPIAQGMIRYNTEINTFEGVGYNSEWIPLGGVTNDSHTTYVTANNDDTTTFYNNSVQTVIIDASGNVGVGSTTPSSKLDIVGDINATTAFKMGTTTVIDSSRNLSNIVDITSTGTVTTTGSVGVGNTAPTYKLDVTGAINSTESYKINGTTIIDSSSNLNNVNTITSRTINNNDLITTSNLNTFGSVGIHKTNPSYTLDVYGDIAASSSYLMGTTTIVDSSRNLSNIATANTTTISNSGTITTQNFYTSSNVGIGTNSAMYTLDVSGTGHFTGSTIFDTIISGTIDGSIYSSQISDLASTLESFTVSTISGSIYASQVSDFATTVDTLSALTISGSIYSSQINDASTNLTANTISGSIYSSQISDASTNLTANTISGSIYSSQISDLASTIDTLSALTISGSIYSSQVSDLTTTVASLTSYAVSTTVEATAQASITQLDNVTSIGSNVFRVNIDSPNTGIHGDAVITGSLTTSNLYVLGGATIINSVTTRLNSNLVIDNSGLSGAALIIYQDQVQLDDGIIMDVYDKTWKTDVPVFRINEADSQGGRISINTTDKTYELNVGGSGHFTSNLIVHGPGLTIPVGSNSQRPVAPDLGMIRYNTELTTFEGYGPGNTWGSLGGVINTARSTYVKAYDNNTIVFENNNSQSAIIDATGHVGIGTTPTYALDVANDINTWSTYKLNGYTLVDNNSNAFFNDATLTGSIHMDPANIDGLFAYVAGIPVDNCATVTSNVLLPAQNTITTLSNVTLLGRASSNLLVNSAAVQFTGSVQVDTITATSNFTTSNMTVFGVPLFASDILVDGDAHVTGTLYAGKVRLGSLYSTTTVNGTLAASLSLSTQLAITQLGTVTVENLTATNSINGNITGSAASANYASTAGSAGYVTFPSQPNITSVGTLTNLTVSSNITAQSLTLGGFTFTIPQNNILQVSYNGSNIAQFVG